MPQLSGRGSGKRSGPAEEARDHCFRVREEGGFRALPKRGSQDRREPWLSAQTTETGMKR